MNDFSNFFGSSINQSALTGHLKGIDGVALFTKFGYSKKEAEQILKGDYEPIYNTNFKFYVLDFNAINNYHANQFNKNLVSFFFQKAKDNEAFTEEEQTAYITAFDNWFNLCFEIGKQMIFTANEELNDKTLIINYYGEYYLMTRIENISNQIIYIGLPKNLGESN